MITAIEFTPAIRPVEAIASTSPVNIGTDLRPEGGGEKFANALASAKSRQSGGIAGSVNKPLAMAAIEAGGSAFSSNYFQQFASIKDLVETSPFDPTYRTKSLTLALEAAKFEMVSGVSMKICAKSVDGFNQLLKTQ